MFGKGMIKKVFMYLFLGPLAFLIGGSINFMDFLIIPMIAPIFSGIFGSFGLNIPGLGGGAAPAATT